MIYIISHPNAAFRGVAGGIDFYNGIGTTSSVDDAKRVAERIKGRFDAADHFKRSSAPADAKIAEAAKAIVEDIRKPEASGAPAPAAEKPKAKAGRKPK